MPFFHREFLEYIFGIPFQQRNITAPMDSPVYLYLLWSLIINSNHHKLFPVVIVRSSHILLVHISCIVYLLANAFKGFGEINEANMSIRLVHSEWENIVLIVQMALLKPNCDFELFVVTLIVKQLINNFQKYMSYNVVKTIHVLVIVYSWWRFMNLHGGRNK